MTKRTVKGDEGVAETDAIDGGAVAVPNPEPEAVVVDGRDPESAAAFMDSGPVQGPFTKVAQVVAVEADADVTIQTPEGEMIAHAGDYIVSDIPPTHLWPVRREVFQETYVLAEEEKDGTWETTDGEIEVHSPGQQVPTSGLYRPVGSESALSKDDRFPPASMAFGWMLFEAAEQKGSKR